MSKTAPPVAASLAKAPKKPTHWKDDRGYVLTTAQREAKGFDWEQVYNVPCKVGAFGRITPLHRCGHCDGKGRDPEAQHDPCPKCGRSGGLPEPVSQA